MLSRLIKKIEDAPVSFFQAFIGMVGIFFIRFFLENFTDPLPSFPAVPDMPTLIQYGSFFAGAFLSLCLVATIFVEDISRVTKVFLAFLPVIWIAPIADLIISRGAGYPMAYVFADGPGILRDALTIGGPGVFGGVSPGMKIEVAVIVIVVFAYLFMRSRSLLKAIIGAALSYVVIYAWLAIPSVIPLIAGFRGASSASAVLGAILGQFSQSHLLSHFVRPTDGVSYIGMEGLLFDLGISHLFFFINAALILGWGALYRPKLIRHIIMNCRPERVAHYFLLIGIGFFSAVGIGKEQPFAGWMDVLSFGTLIVSFFCAWLFAVAVNDAVDIDIDRISNRNRPLVSGAVSEREMKAVACVVFCLSVLGGYLAGYWALFSILVFTAAYYIYSAPPLRIRRMPVLGMFLISLACLSAATAGFYFASSSQLVSSFPLRLAILIVVFFTLAANIKDIKDIKGDGAEGIMTIPVMLGERVGKTVVGGFAAAAMLCVPVILGQQALFLPAVVGAALAYYFAVAEPFREWRLFALYFAWVAIAGLLLWF